MPGGKSSFMNPRQGEPGGVSAAGPLSMTAAAALRKNSSSSINFDISKSPDSRSVALEKELSDITLDEQADRALNGQRSVSFGIPPGVNGRHRLPSFDEAGPNTPGGNDSHTSEPDTESSPGLAQRSISAIMAQVPACMSFADLNKNFEKEVEDVYGEPHPSRDIVRRARRIIVKVGTAVVTRGRDHRLALGRLGALVEQLEALVRSGRQVILVTSGGVSVGRQKLRQQQVLNSSPLEMQIQGPSSVSSRAAAAAGQSGLMALYDSLFSMMDLQAAQVLVTSNDFTDVNFKENLCATVEDLLSMNVVPVFNENDAISKGAALSKESARNAPFWDNDSLAALLAVELQADLLMLMTDVDGLYTGPPNEPASEIIPTYCPQVHDRLIKFGIKSDGGRGGMIAKVDAAWKAAEGGVTTVIASGKGGDCILQAVAGQRVGTMFDKAAAAEALVEHENRLKRVQSQSRSGSLPLPASHEAQGARSSAQAARNAARALQSLDSEARENLLLRIADAIESNTQQIMDANEADVAEARAAETDEHLMQRLGLSSQKLANLTAGIRSIARQPEPIRKVLSRMELAEGLVLEKVTSPIGVLLIIFEARPEALPQIAALAIRSGNGLLLKGGKEASRSNAILHKVITDTIAAAAPEVGREVISLVTTREGVDELLALDDVIDLVIPRGSNALVSHIQQNTRIPVLGHADGVCHMYVDPAADISAACALAVDSKVDYPAACNALETLLVHQALAQDGRLFQLIGALRDHGVTIHGGERAAHSLGLQPASSPKHEYGAKELTLELVADIDEAIDHIHRFGSSHTEAIVTEDAALAEEFLRRVDSACVHVNASTRFSDGFRYGLGAEVGVSTGRIHARGPVGVEGLLTTKWLLRGSGQTVAKDAHISYTHRSLPVA